MGRIFWLGMHKVLKPTELRRLRGLGFEVFNPAYISPTYDQSADLRIDLDQPTTLPPEIFARLISYDFFYRPIETDIAEILNEYFDTVIVTINADWLKEFAKVFSGKLIFRIYGQPYVLSEHMIGIGCWELLADRDNFSIVPFAEEAIAQEHQWFTDRVSHIVPYQVPDDVFEYSGRWGETRREEIATSIPNIQNPYYAAAYHAFAAKFPQSYFRIYGPQRDHPADRRIVNALPRSALFDSLRWSSGYYYDYRDSVCYLPPIESMQLGVPVVCTEGSLLADFLGRHSPNVCEDSEDSRLKLQRLLNGDAVLAAELLEGQEQTRRRYDPAVVGPIFDAAFTQLISGDDTSPGTVAPATAKARPAVRVAVALHVDGLFHRNGRKTYAIEGIPRVVDAIVRTLASNPNIGFVISCTRASQHVVRDFFIDNIRSGAVELHVLDFGTVRAPIDELRVRTDFVQALDNDPSIATVLVPHYYLFPELMLTSKRVVLYLPDYFPHLSPNAIFDVSAAKDAQNKAIGVALAKKADVVLTNSNFTKRYLPDAGFVDERDLSKVVVVPLPFLGAGRASALSTKEITAVRDGIGRRPFIFYPTANRPNKRLDFLMELYSTLLETEPTLGLVLTGSLDSYQPVRERADALGVSQQITFMHGASEGTLRWLYENCSLLCLSSVLEGNFPPQMLEALNYGAPIVATRLPTVTEILGDQSDQLLLCRALDRDDFLEKINIALHDRDAVLERQAIVVEALRKWNSDEAFSAGLGRVFPEFATSSLGAV